MLDKVLSLFVRDLKLPEGVLVWPAYIQMCKYLCMLDKVLSLFICDLKLAEGVLVRPAYSLANFTQPSRFQVLVLAPHPGTDLYVCMYVCM